MREEGSEAVKRAWCLLIVSMALAVTGCPPDNQQVTTVEVGRGDASPVATATMTPAEHAFYTIAMDRSKFTEDRHKAAEALMELERARMQLQLLGRLEESVLRAEAAARSAERAAGIMPGVERQ